MAARAKMSPRHVLWTRRRGLHLAFVAVDKLAVIGEKKKKRTILWLGKTGPRTDGQFSFPETFFSFSRNFYFLVKADCACTLASLVLSAKCTGAIVLVSLPFLDPSDIVLRIRLQNWLH